MNDSTIFSSGTAIRIPRPSVVIRQLKNKLVKNTVHSSWMMEVAEEYGLPIQGTVKALVGSSKTESWVIPTREGKKVLKRYKKSLDYEHIFQIHSIVNYLSQIKFPTPQLVAIDKGETIVEYQGRHYALFDFLDGFSKYGEYFYIPEQMLAFLWAKGKTLGILHQALKDSILQEINLANFKLKTDAHWKEELSWYLDKLHLCREEAISESKTFHQPIIDTLINKSNWIVDTLQELEETLNKANLECQPIHGDYGHYNVMVKPGHPLVVIDFDFTRLDWRLIDIIATLSSSTQTSDQFWEENLHKMVLTFKAYTSENELDDNELHYLPQIWQYVLLRRVIMCWDRYRDRGEMSNLNEAQRRLERLDWVNRHKEDLVNLNRR
jgi:Ser/Thr protein kinase RdoA (MazF antagonist)